MVNETPVNYTEIFRKEIAESLKVNVDAREQRIAIEDSLKLDPFIDHLYSEGEFEKLIFFEQRRTNDLLMKILEFVSGAHIVPEKPVYTNIHPTIPTKVETIIEVPSVPSGEIVSVEQDRPPYAYASDEPMDPKTGIHQVESDGLSPAERATLSDGLSPAERVTLTEPLKVSLPYPDGDSPIPDNYKMDPTLKSAINENITKKEVTKKPIAKKPVGRGRR